MSLSEPTFAYIVASEEEDAPVAILAELPNGDQIWSGEISNALFNEQSQETQDQLGSDSGDFIVHADQGEVRVLARAANAEAAMILTEAYARLLAARQDGSAEDDGAATRHTLSVQATDKSDRAEGVAALQQAWEPVARGAVFKIAERAIYRTAHDGPEHLCGLIADEVIALFSPQQTALVEEGVEEIIGPHEPAACGASAPSEALRHDGGG